LRSTYEQMRSVYFEQTLTMPQSQISPTADVANNS
jgi:hypothetical protein